jgi:hypothetical protein
MVAHMPRVAMYDRLETTCAVDAAPPRDGACPSSRCLASSFRADPSSLRVCIAYMYPY